MCTLDNEDNGQLHPSANADDGLFALRQLRLQEPCFTRLKAAERRARSTVGELVVIPLTLTRDAFVIVLEDVAYQCIIFSQIV